MRQEKEVTNDTLVNPNRRSEARAQYNKNGLIVANESFHSKNLSFVETFQVCEYEVADHDENDDLEREVYYYY